VSPSEPVSSLPGSRKPGADAVRAFIAIELPSPIRQALAAIEAEIQAQAGAEARKAIRWVPAENMHLTLRFLGEVSSGNLQALAGMLRSEANRHPAFSFSVGGLGAFPNPRRPRVIWVGMEAPGELTALQKAIETETNHLGYPAEERPFSPHLTLGRISQNARPEEVNLVARALGEVKVETVGQVQVRQVHLFRSDLHPSGAVYTKLFSFDLRAREH